MKILEVKLPVVLVARNNHRGEGSQLTSALNRNKLHKRNKKCLFLFQERVSLKHRNTSKWAKHLMTKGGKNADVR